MPTSYVQHYLPDLDAEMRLVVNTIPSETPDFSVMMRYALGWVDEHDQPYTQVTGKRIRPILLLLCAEAAGGDWNIALPAAAAVELLHNFSLIHDDIQDDSPIRHKRPTVWKIWGSPNAINAGDALFTLSYRALEGLTRNHIKAETIIQAWHIFNNTAIELTRGQHLDMRFERQSIVAVDDYISMISGKSAALIAACAQIGALVACNDSQLALNYADFGLNLGIAFQIHDDILGIWGDPTITGKSAATDILSRKKSLPVLYGLDRSIELTKIYEQEKLTGEDVSHAVNALDSLGARDYTQNAEKEFYQKALDSLEKANPQGEAARGLIQLVDDLFARQA